MPSLAHRAQYAALRGTVSALERLSWTQAGAVGAVLGAIGYRPFGVRRHVVERQLAAAFPAMPHDEVRRVARAAYEHLGRVTIEAALVPTLGPAGVLELFEARSETSFAHYTFGPRSDYARDRVRSSRSRARAHERCG